MPKVKRGDVCIVSDTKTVKEIKNTTENVRGYHAFIITKSEELTDATATAHLTWGGLEFLPFKGHFAGSDKVTIFRCGIGGLGKSACDHATTWTNKSPNKPLYSHARGAAVMHDLPSLGNLPYGFDALRRSVKWARKHDREFSTNKGLTCAAYVVACYQAAAFGKLGFNKLDATWKILEDSRLAKAEFRKRGNATHPDYRESANPGVKAGSEADAIKKVLDFLGLGTGNPESLLKGLLSEAMYTDARFIHTDGLFRRLSSSSSGWEKVHEHLPTPQVIIQNPVAVVRTNTPIGGVNPLYAGGVNPLYGGGNNRTAAVRTNASIGGVNPLYAGGGNQTAASDDDDLFADVKVDHW